MEENKIPFPEEIRHLARINAILEKALDKAETILQHNQGKNPPDFDYGFNLEYGKPYFSFHPLLKELRSLLDAQTAARIREGESPAEET